MANRFGFLCMVVLILCFAVNIGLCQDPPVYYKIKKDTDQSQAKDKKDKEDSDSESSAPVFYKIKEYKEIDENARMKELQNQVEKLEKQVNKIRKTSKKKQPAKKTEKVVQQPVKEVKPTKETASETEQRPEQRIVTQPVKPVQTQPQKSFVQPAPVREEKVTHTESAPMEPAEVKTLQQQLETLRKEMQTIREEQDARKKLEITDDEKRKKEEELLTAAGREYTLMKKGNLGLDYSFNYSYYSTDVLLQAVSVEQRSNHSLSSTVAVDYPIMNNLTMNVSVPFSYQYSEQGTDGDCMCGNDIGDINTGFKYQPIKSGGALPSVILSGGYSFATGRSPYKIVPGKDISTGAGFPSANFGMSLSKTIDPIVTYGSLSYAYTFEADTLSQNTNGRVLRRVDPGDSISFSFGLGYALSYKVNVSMSVSYGYSFATSYYWADESKTESEASVSASFAIGFGWAMTPSQSINWTVGYGLTKNNPDFSLAFRIPIVIDLWSS